jgi:hypothetical protein
MSQLEEFVQIFLLLKIKKNKKKEVQNFISLVFNISNLKYSKEYLEKDTQTL